MIRYLVGLWALFIGYSAQSNTLVLDPLRTVLLDTEVRPPYVLPLLAQLTPMFESKRPIYLVITSRGGEFETGTMINEALDMAKERGIVVKCVVPIGAASMAFSIFTHCGERYALPSAQLMFHQGRTNPGSITSMQAELVVKNLNEVDAIIIGEVLQCGIDEDVFAAAFMEAKTWTAAELSKACKPGWLNIVTNIEGVDARLFGAR